MIIFVGSAWEGLKMALKDPKVLIFSVMNCSQLLGLSFVNFFPTCVPLAFSVSWIGTYVDVCD